MRKNRVLRTVLSFIGGYLIMSAISIIVIYTVPATALPGFSQERNNSLLFYGISPSYEDDIDLAPFWVYIAFFRIFVAALTSWAIWKEQPLNRINVVILIFVVLSFIASIFTPMILSFVS